MMGTDRRGVVLILAVGCMAILSILLGALNESSFATQQIVNRRESELRATLAATSGLNYCLQRLRERGLWYIHTKETDGEAPPPEPSDEWITQPSIPHQYRLREAVAPHESTRSSFFVTLDTAFVRANLRDPGQNNLELARQFQLTVDGIHESEDGRQLARRTLEVSFLGANVVLIKTRETP